MTRDRWIGAVMIMIAPLALVTGCSKNEAASSACSSMSDSEACSACCTKNGANGYKFITGSTCDCLGGGGAAKTSAPTGASGGSTPAFAGTYKSAWGTTVFSQDGNRVTAKYPNGTMTCTASGSTLDCDWKEAVAFGKAKLTKQADGSIKGTWGNGDSSTNGGPWLFNP